MSARLILPLRGTPGRLVKSLAALIGDPRAAVPMYPMLVVEGVISQPWSSATFDGERHRIDLRLHGSAAQIGEAIDRLIMLLPDAEFDLPGQIVAEAKLVTLGVDPDPCVVAATATIEFVTVID